MDVTYALHSLEKLIRNIRYLINQIYYTIHTGDMTYWFDWIWEKMDNKQWM